MSVLTSQIERESEVFAERRGQMEALVAELRERTGQVARGGGDKAIERHRGRGKLTARERVDRLLDPGSAFLELGALAAWDVYEGQAPSAGIVTGIGVVEGQECVIVANDATVKGRHLLPAHGQEAPARPGGGRAERAALHLPRRLGRRVPAAPGRGLPRSRPFRPDLLQPGPDVRERHPADRLGHGLVHGRRRLRAGDERRDDHRQGHGHDLHRRAAAREGSDGRRT